MTAPTDNKTVLLSVEHGAPVTPAVLDKWGETLNGALDKIEQVVIDLTKNSKVTPSEISSIARFLGPAVKKNGWEVSMICSPETEKTVNELGLSGFFRCFQIHAKQAPKGDVGASAGAHPQDVRQEISAFFSFLAPSFEYVAQTLFTMPMAYQPPLDVQPNLAAEVGGEAEAVIVRAETEAFSYRIVFLLKPQSKEKIVHAFFRGKPASDGAKRDLLCEVANTVVGHLAGQLRQAARPISVKAAIPELLPAGKPLPAKDLEQMKGKAALRFQREDVSLTIIVGYNLKQA